MKKSILIWLGFLILGILAGVPLSCNFGVFISKSFFNRYAIDKDLLVHVQSLERRLVQVEHDLQTYELFATQDVDNTIPKRSIIDDFNKKISSWQISFDYENVFGPYEFAENLLFLFPDGSFSLLNYQGRSVRNGSIDTSIQQPPLIRYPLIYSLSRTGVLSAFDMLAAKTVWKTEVALPSQIDFFYSNGYLLIPTPDYRIFLVHADTGIITDTLSFPSWECSPDVFSSNLYVALDDTINIFTIPGFDEIKIQFTEDKVIDFFQQDTDIAIKGEKGWYSISDFRIKSALPYSTNKKTFGWSLISDDNIQVLTYPEALFSFDFFIPLKTTFYNEKICCVIDQKNRVFGFNIL